MSCSLSEKDLAQIDSSIYVLPLQDFYNLVDVYLDAVFHPRCINDPKVFEQEGWHYELDNAEVRFICVL